MPDFEDPAAKLEKKQKWGHAQAVRQSSRIDRSKNIMEKAEERRGRLTWKSHRWKV
jgi:hypothetical protein